MSGRRAMTRALGVISGFLILLAGLTGILLIGSATPAPAATNPCAAQLTAVSVSRASATATPSASASVSTSASASASVSASATPTPTVSTSSSASATPSPTPTTTSPSPSPTSTSPSPSPTSTSPSPSPTSTSPSPSDHLCITVQPLAANVKEGGQARYAIWVWLAGKVNGSAKINIAAKPGKLSPAFTVCAALGGTTCSVGLTAAQAVQLRAAVTVPRNAGGTDITLTATGTSAQSAASASASGSVTVIVASTPAATPSTDPLGAGVTLPGGLPPGELSSAGLPPLPGAVSDPSVAFPQVTPTPDPTPAPVPIHVSDVSASFPLSTRLVGGQIVGLAVLAAAVTIAVARLSLRKQRPPGSQDPG
jgi:hypothetical protein